MSKEHDLNKMLKIIREDEEATEKIFMENFTANLKKIDPNYFAIIYFDRSSKTCEYSLFGEPPVKTKAQSMDEIYMMVEDFVSTGIKREFILLIKRPHIGIFFDPMRKIQNIDELNVDFKELNMRAKIDRELVET